MNIVQMGYGFDPTPAQSLFDSAIQNGLARRQNTGDINMSLQAGAAEAERQRTATLGETLRLEKLGRAKAMMDTVWKDSGTLTAYQQAFKAGGAGENDPSWAATRDAFMRGVIGQGYSQDEANGMYQLLLNGLGMQVGVANGTAGTGGGGGGGTPTPPQPTPPVPPTPAPMGPAGGARAPAQAVDGPFKAGQPMSLAYLVQPAFGAGLGGTDSGMGIGVEIPGQPKFMGTVMDEGYANNANRAYVAYVQAMNAYAKDPQAVARMLGIPGAVMSPAMVAQAINTKYGVNIDYAKVGPSVTPAPTPPAAGRGSPTVMAPAGARTGTGAGKATYAAGKAPGQPQRPLSAVGLAMHEASTGDIHRPALVGDQEGIVNANAMAAGGSEIVRRLNELFPAAGGPSQAPGQRAYAGGYSPPAPPVTPAPSASPAPQGPALSPSSPAPQAPQAPDREDVMQRLVAAGSAELDTKAPPKALTTTESRRWGESADRARAAYDAMAQGAMPDPALVRSVLKDAVAATKDGRVQRLSAESSAWAARVLKNATAEELAFLGGQFGQAADARLSRQNTQDELAMRLKIAKLQIEAAQGGAASPLTYAFEMAKMILGDSVGKMDGKSILKKRATDSLYNEAYNVFQGVFGKAPTDVVKGGWFKGLVETPAAQGVQPFSFVADRGQAAGVEGQTAAAQAPQDTATFLAQTGAVRH